MAAQLNKDKVLAEVQSIDVDDKASLVVDYIEQALQVAQEKINDLPWYAKFAGNLLKQFVESLLTEGFRRFKEERE